MDNRTSASRPASPLAYMREKMTQADAAFRHDLAAATDGTDVSRLARTLLALCDDVADELLRIGPVKPLACRAGCDTCCRSLIQVNPVFAVLAVAEARRTFSRDRFQALKDRLASGTPFCPFLFDGVCSIYHSRPMVCRGYYSLDLDLCKQGDYCEKNLGYQGDEAHAAHQLMIFLFSLEKRIEGIEADLGLDPGPVFLDAAARVLLETPTAPDAWLSGGRIFSGNHDREKIPAT
ncbi:hypothetical protein HLH34_09445 [Gluconacetobacter azotocaptans]|uniref:YkgJ family cysteine cluster protein n=2 Tax=Gluconacetobacter azotocaptans TaxID=142834 RepID=A0A7W4JSM6_9PROT|nr:hypothetical protein [Gluconacetobacter azotocaptans]